jgi:hypothetical protein
MSVLSQIATLQNRRDEIPNQELAHQLVECRNMEGIREVAQNLWNKDVNIQSDCIKILYEIGYLQPDLIADYWQDFLSLLKSKNNRLVWGAMITLSTISRIQADNLFLHRSEIQKSIDTGSVITIDNGIKILAGIASTSKTYREDLLPYLFRHLITCRPKDVPQHCESILPGVDREHCQEFINILYQRMEDLNPSQVARVRKVIKAAELGS